MKIDAKISILFNEGGLHIEIVDAKSGCVFFRGRMNETQTCAALSRTARTDVEHAEVFGLEHIGKRRETKKITARVPEYTYDKGVVQKIAEDACPEGWKVHDSFNSQDSFFSDGGERYVRFIIVRWVDDEEAI